MRKPSVVFFNRVYPPARGATGRILRDLARAFARDGWDVTVITTGPRSRTERDGAVRVIRLKATGQGKSLFFYGRVWLKMLLAGLSLPRRDLIVTMTDPPLFVVAGRLVAKAKKSAHINWCQDLYPDLLPAVGMRIPAPVMKFFKVSSRRAMKSCDKVVVVGRCMAKHLTHSGMDPRRVAVIPNWPDAELAGGATRRRLLRTKLAEQVSGARPYEKLFRDAEPKFRVLYSAISAAPIRCRASSTPRTCWRGGTRRSSSSSSATARNTTGWRRSGRGGASRISASSRGNRRRDCVS